MKSIRSNSLTRVIFLTILLIALGACGGSSEIFINTYSNFEVATLDKNLTPGLGTLDGGKSNHCCRNQTDTCETGTKKCDRNTQDNSTSISTKSADRQGKKNKCANNPCQNAGKCTESLNSLSGYICSCKTGYHGTNCEKIIEQCSNGTCQNNGPCCDIGYSGVDCSVDINECATNNGGCENDCIDSAQDPNDEVETLYACTCDSGFQWSPHKMKCVDINECQNGEHDCDDKAACGNIPGFFFCSPWTCTGDEDCLSETIPSNFQCIDQYCKPTTCVSNNDCAENQHCVNRTCKSYFSCEHTWGCINKIDTPICYFNETDNSADQGKCVACLSNNDCLSSGQECLDNSCVTPCTESSDCNGEICHEEIGKCIPCAHDSECGDMLCQQDTGVCVYCLNQADCGECELCSENTCISYLPCASDNDCAGNNAYCDMTTKQCGQCLEDTHCADNKFCDSGNCIMDTCLPGTTACDGLSLLTCLPNGSTWGAPSTCMSGLCVDGACEDMTCDDGIHNGNETAADCGGNVCAPCDNNLACTLNTDCKSDICSNEICQPLCPANEFSGPVLFDGIYYDHIARNEERRDLAAELNQGSQTHKYNDSVGNDVLYYIYNGAVDWNADLEYTVSDIESFKEWIDTELEIPVDYAGPIVLDMEGAWWDMIATSTTQAQMDVIVDFYLQGLEYAKTLRPNALFGYWGLPLKGHSDPDHSGPSMKRLLMAQGAIFPDTYEWNPGGNDYIRLKKHIKNTIALVEGKVPVYPQMSPRWKRRKSECLNGAECMPSSCGMHEQDEILSNQAKAILDAAWEAPDGTLCKSAGLAVWDAYIFERYCYQDEDPAYDAFCASTTCDEDLSCAGNCSCADGVSCNSENFCVELQYTSGELCNTSCNETCTGKEMCINGHCNPPWWRWYELSNSEISTVWDSLDSYHKSLYQALTKLVETYQPSSILETSSNGL